jgi:hypothetical protein
MRIHCTGNMLMSHVVATIICSNLLRNWHLTTNILLFFVLQSLYSNSLYSLQDIISLYHSTEVPGASNSMTPFHSISVKNTWMHKTLCLVNIKFSSRHEGSYTLYPMHWLKYKSQLQLRKPVIEIGLHYCIT